MSGQWLVVPSRWSVVGVTVISGRWSLAGRWAVVLYYASWEGNVFKVFSRWFLRVMTHVENGNCFSYALYNLTDIGLANEKSQVVTKVKKIKML